MVAILQAEGVTFPGDKPNAQGKGGDEQAQAAPANPVDKCFDYAFKLLSWKQFRKLGERIIAVCDEHDAE